MNIIQVQPQVTNIIEVYDGADVIEVLQSVTSLVQVVAEGPQGPQGLPGLSGASFVHDQAVASDLWIIAHNLGRFPSITVVDSTGDVVEGDVKYIDSNVIHLSFSAGLAGKVFVN